MEVCQICADIGADIKLNYCELCFVCSTCAQDLITFKDVLKCPCAMPILLPNYNITTVQGKMIDQLFRDKARLVMVTASLDQLEMDLVRYQYIDLNILSAKITFDLDQKAELVSKWRRANNPLVKNIELAIDQLNVSYTLLTQAINKHLMFITCGNDLRLWYQHYHRVIDVITYPTKIEPKYQIYIYDNFISLFSNIVLPVVGLIAQDYNIETGNGVQLDRNGNITTFKDFKLHGHSQNNNQWCDSYHYSDSFYSNGCLLTRYIYAGLNLAKGPINTVTYLEFTDNKPSIIYCQAISNFQYVCYLRLKYDGKNIYSPGSFFNNKLVPKGSTISIDGQTYLNLI